MRQGAPRCVEGDSMVGSVGKQHRKDNAKKDPAVWMVAEETEKVILLCVPLIENELNFPDA